MNSVENSNDNIDYLNSLNINDLTKLISDIKSNLRLLNNLIKNQESKVTDLLFSGDDIFLDDNIDNCIYSIEHNKLDSLKREKVSLNNYLKKCHIILEKK